METKEVTNKEVKLLWHDDWYDGELAGFLEYQGIFCYFSIIDQYDPLVDTGWYRKYAIHPLSESEVKYEKDRQEWRRKCVGNDNEYGDSPMFYLQDASWEKFSEKFPEAGNEEKYINRPVVAVLKM